MIPLIKAIIHALLWDELAAIRWLRGACLTFAAGGVAFADQIAGILGEAGAPRVVQAIKLVAVACGFLGGAITAGQRNPPATTAPTAGGTP
ncbi:hypothetical protein [Anaeromyxobacter oryzisoli]|uniref:hypothetical protein n=1 Tax=Anaeromyxobacter oryzisoli TaxID=2925408 RepID=UPI001F5770F6|nr:hypothetical protein [Anaeromyxobacter sp. SG63]